MEFLHTEFHGGRDHTVLVTLDKQANVMLLDDSNFAAYRQGQAFSYYGGWMARSPVRLVPPHGGHWNVVVDLGGNSGTIRARTRIVRGRLPSVS